MNHLSPRDLRVLLLSLFVASCFSSTIDGQETKNVETVSKQFWADAKIFSLQPGEESATYRSFGGSGGVGPGGTLTLGARDKQHHFDVRIATKLQAQRFLAKVTVKPGRDDVGTKPQEIDYDLSDLTARTLEIARDDDGRVYRLSLIPIIREKPLPMQFSAADLQLEQWGFPNCPVILNDQEYIGQLAMSRGPLAFCDIPGVAKVEFSLLHLKDALPIGTLEKGVINITHENGTSLRISDVRNGRNQDVLSGGPYRVWVRWKKPSETLEQYRESLKRQIAKLKERMKSGDLSLPAGTLERLEKMSESGRIGLIETGIRPVRPSDLVEGSE
jgi:hypothetical protein